MSTPEKMSLLQFLKRGLQFQVCGEIGETLSFEDSRTGAINRFVRIEGFQRTFNLEVDTDEQLRKFASMQGTQVRASGKLGRRRNAAAATARLENLLVPGMPGWVDLAEKDILEGSTFEGVGVVTDKKYSEFRGIAYRSMQLGMMGETFLFREIDPEIFETLPESGPAKVSGHLDAKLVNGQSGLMSDLILKLSECRAVGGASREARPDPDREKKPA